MTPVLSYLLKANIVLIALYVFYFLCFRRDTFYGHIRWYLLATIAAAIIFPLINISAWLTGSPAAMEVSHYIPNVEMVYQYVFVPQEYTVETATARSIPFGVIFLWCWLLVALFMLGKRLFQIACIARLWHRYPQQRCGKSTLITIDRNIQPFSFSDRIFLNTSLYSEKELDEIVAHEQVHCREKHTIDILLSEAFICLCWFNPVAWLLRRDLKQNLEFYTDRMTLQSGFDRKSYQYCLLRVSGNNYYQIVNHFHFNNIKKRIIMLNKKESPRIMTAKYLLVIPALVAALLTVQASALQTTETNDIIVVDENPAAAQQQQDVPRVRFPTTENSQNPPLYVIDGRIAPEEELRKIDPDNIESISVLKNESAVEKYGERGKNGVILITTKTPPTVLRSREQGDPLIIVDGKEVESLEDISPDSIQSIDVLKESAITEYGEKGTNGVIIVTTKK